MKNLKFLQKTLLERPTLEVGRKSVLVQVADDGRVASVSDDRLSEADKEAIAATFPTRIILESAKHKVSCSLYTSL